MSKNQPAINWEELQWLFTEHPASPEVRTQVFERGIRDAEPTSTVSKPVLVARRYRCPVHWYLHIALTMLEDNLDITKEARIF